MARSAESWVQQVVASLRHSKEADYTFNGAWRHALQENPAPRVGNNRDVPAALFVVDGQDHEETPLAEWYEGVCEDAWYGRRPALRAFSLDMLRLPDGSREARRSGSHSRAA